jgi:hypothetical protein
MIFFLDESGQDLHEAPYEVRAAVDVPNEALWGLLQEMIALEKKHFGVALAEVGGESKGKKLLSRKRFAHAKQCRLLAEDYRRNLVRAFLQRGAISKHRKQPFVPYAEELAAYAQAGHAYVKDVLNAARRRQCKAFAAIVDKRVARPENQVFLRKDYRYLLDRFSRHTQSISDHETGLMVFDQTEASDSRRLLQQMESYANETVTGYRTSQRLVPAPFFVDSRLTPVVQLADLVAYIVNWGIRFGKVTAERRDELKDFSRIVREMEWSGNEPDELGTRSWISYGFFHVKSLLDRVKDEEISEKKKGADTQSAPRKDQQKPSGEGLKSAQEQSLLPLDLSNIELKSSEAKIEKKPKPFMEELFGQDDDLPTTSPENK